MSSLKEPTEHEGGGGSGEGISLESSPSYYEPSTMATEDDGESMQEISDYWAQNGGTRSLEDLNEELKEKLMQKDTEIMNYKHQLENRSPPIGIEELDKAELLSELHIAKQTIEELKQEVVLGKMLLEKSSGTTPPQGNGETHPQGNGESSETCNSCKELGRDMEAARSENEGISADLEKTKEELSIREGELEQTRSELQKTRADLESAREGLLQTTPNGAGPHTKASEELEKELESAQLELGAARETTQRQEKKLAKTRDTLSSTEKQLEETKQELVQTRSALSSTETLSSTEKRLEEELAETRSTLSITEKRLEEAKQELDESSRKVTPRKTNTIEKRIHIKLEESIKEKRKIEEEKLSLEKELRNVEVKFTKTQSVLETVREECQGETSKRMDVEHQRTLEERSFKCELSECSTRNTNLQEEVARFSEDLQSTREKEESLVLEVEREKTARRGTETQLQQVLEEKEEVAREKEEVVRSNTAMLACINEAEQHKSQLQTKVLQAEEVCGGFKEEAEKTFDSYSKVCQELKRVKEEYETMRTTKDKIFNTLSIRTEEVKTKEKELATKDEELKQKDEESKDKLLALEKSKADTVYAASQQMEQYVQDFAREREAREKCIVKIGELHRVQGEMKKQMENLERNKKELREQLNLQSASQCQAEFAEELTEYNSFGSLNRQPRDPRPRDPRPRDPRQSH